MRLSEAILIGSTILSPCQGGKFGIGNRGIDGRGCALDMALASMGHPDWSWLESATIWPWLRETWTAPLPEFFHTYLSVGSHTKRYVIARVFDGSVISRKSLTFEQFIDWVRSVEPSDPEPPKSVDEMEILYQGEREAA